MSDQVPANLPDLSHLTEDERNKILSVLNKDEIFQKKQWLRFIELQQEIDILESKSIDIPTEHIETATICVRCKNSFGYFYFYNQGDFCPRCHYKVCQKCQINQLDTKTRWLCTLCHKYNQYLVQTGNWIYSEDTVVNKKKFPLRKDSLTGSQIIKLTLLPEKKEEILGQIKSTQLPKSTLTRTASVLESNQINLKNSYNYKENITSNETQYQEKEEKNNSNRSFNDLHSSAGSCNSSNNSIVKKNTLENKNLLVITDTIPVNTKKVINYDLGRTRDDKRFPLSTNRQKIIINTQNSLNNRPSIIRNISTATIIDTEKTPRNATDKKFQFDKEKIEIKKITDNDLDSVTSSELDTTSINSDAKTPQLSERIFKETIQKLSENNLKNLSKLTDIVVKENNLNERSLIQNDNSLLKISVSKNSLNSTSSKKNENLSENDDNLLQMDKIFAQAKESIKIQRNETVEEKDKDYSEKNLDIGQPFIISQLGQYPKIESKNKLRSLSSHMSLMRRSRKKLERTTSMKSVNQDFEIDSNDPIRGKIQLKLDYDKKSSNLNVRVIKCEDLINTQNKTCDSYVKIYLIPGNKDKNNKRKTSIKKNTPNPVYNETLRYVLSHVELVRNKLWISVWNSDKFGRNKFLGEISVSLEPEILTENSPKWYDLRGRVNDLD